ncbi:MAG: TetR/AcrR family transcriptional regulator [Gammaproteobacteria bacterium]
MEHENRGTAAAASSDAQSDQSEAPKKKVDARTRILQTASTEFARKGFDGVSTTEIAKEAGVTQPLIHYHFKSKMALWQATVEQIFKALRDEFANTRIDCSELGQKERIVELLRRFVQFAGKYPEFGQFLLREGTQKSERLEWMIDTWGRPTLGLVVDDYRRGIEEGWLKDIPFPQVISIITAASMQFFALAPMIESMYGVDSHDPEQVKIHTDTVVDLISNAMFVKDTIEAA